MNRPSLKLEFTNIIIPHYEYKLQNGSKSVLPEWLDCLVHLFKEKQQDDLYVTKNAYEIGFASGYLKDESGVFIPGKDIQLTHSKMMEYLHEYCKELRPPKLREDMIARILLDQRNSVFNEDFGRTKSRMEGYMTDYTTKYNGKNSLSGADGNQLIVRVLHHRYPNREGGDKPVVEKKIGPIVMAGDSGVVPRLTKRELEKNGVKLPKLEALGVIIPSKDDEIVDVRSPLGYPLLVFDDLPLGKHGEHFDPPGKDAGERVVLRSVFRYDGHECFKIDANCDPKGSSTLRSCRLVYQLRRSTLERNDPYVRSNRPAVGQK